VNLFEQIVKRKTILGTLWHHAEKHDHQVCALFRFCIFHFFSHRLLCCCSYYL